MDLLTSMLQDITDDQTFFCATSRERRLAMAYESYKAWAEEAKVTDRAGQRLFTTSILTNTKVVEVSQKVLNATACRYMILWAAQFMSHVCHQLSNLPQIYKYLGCRILCLGISSGPYVKACSAIHGSCVCSVHVPGPWQQRAWPSPTWSS